MVVENLSDSAIDIKMEDGTVVGFAISKNSIPNPAHTVSKRHSFVPDQREVVDQAMRHGVGPPQNHLVDVKTPVFAALTEDRYATNVRRKSILDADDFSRSASLGSGDCGQHGLAQTVLHAVWQRGTAGPA